MRKKENEYHQTGKLDIRGTGSITDLVDNVIIVSRNKQKERVVEKQKLGMHVESNEQKHLDARDAYLIVEKNRHGQHEGATGLYFNSQSMQYTSRDIPQPMPAPWVIKGEAA